MENILVNMIRTPDGTVLQSRHRHDYVTYTDKNGLQYMVDGGLDYLRRNVHVMHPYEELSVYEEDPIEVIRERFDWGTYGKDGKQPFTRILLKNMTEEHIQAILDTQRLQESVRNMFHRELVYRKENEPRA